VSLIFISHRLEEVFEIADRVTVLRDGERIGTASLSELDEDEVVRMMVGRAPGKMYPKADAKRGDVILEAVNLSDGRELHGVDVTLHEGEILGVAGLVGAGRTALAETLFGIRPAETGEVRIDERRVNVDSPGKAIRLGMGLVPEDRNRQGLFMNMAVRENIVLSAMNQVTEWIFVNVAQANRLAKRFVDRLEIRTPSLGQRVRNLSGGNQQKVIIARWLTLKPKVLILDEPTRGIDVSAKAEIHALMGQLAQDGVGVLMISSELPEILGISDRILVMREGRVAGEFAPDEATQDDLMVAATGGKVNAG
jgi:ABC-type sugar transport system ATPase subunit